MPGVCPGHRYRAHVDLYFLAIVCYSVRAVAQAERVRHGLVMREGDRLVGHAADALVVEFALACVLGSGQELEQLDSRWYVEGGVEHESGHGGLEGARWIGKGLSNPRYTSLFFIEL